MTAKLWRATAIALIACVLCFLAWVGAMAFADFHPRGDYVGEPAPIVEATTDVHLYSGLFAFAVAFVLLHLVGDKPFGFVGGLWRGAVASAAGPIGYVLPILLLSPFTGTSPAVGPSVAVISLIGAFLFWAVLLVPVVVGLIAGGLSAILDGLTRAAMRI